ncbi:hypothetical protein [Intestinimonas sp.]|uniref:hypothetical protein n=1 Tax=Intestinimonas sp. TaxID=1965293 RepID=UPI002632A46E|nr:hypothetical protein [Intestinimonas sp.]
MKKFGIACYLNIVAAILGIVGLFLTVRSSTMSADNALTNLSTLILAGVVAIVLVCVAIVAPSRLGNHDPLSTVSVLGAIALYCYLFGSCVSQRVMLIAGLFSFNDANTMGWSIFYTCIGAWVCLLLGILLLVIGSFLNSVKEPKAA